MINGRTGATCNGWHSHSRCQMCYRCIAENRQPLPSMNEQSKAIHVANICTFFESILLLPESCGITYLKHASTVAIEPLTVRRPPEETSARNCRPPQRQSASYPILSATLPACTPRFRPMHRKLMLRSIKRPSIRCVIDNRAELHAHFRPYTMRFLTRPPHSSLRV